MKKTKKTITAALILRQKAEKVLENKPLKPGTQMTETEILRLVHELQVHQIELEMQNEELRNARDVVEITSLKYTELYDFAPTGYFTLSKKGEIVEINLSGAKLLGKNSSELINSNFKFFVSNDTRSVFNFFLQNIFDYKTKQTCEVILSPDENLPVYVYLSGIPNDYGEQCFITAVDVSEKKQIAEALRVSEENNRNFILQTAMDGFWLIDLQGKLQEVNETYCRMSGYREQELLIMHISDLEHVESKHETIVHMQKTINQGQDHFETRHHRKDGTVFDVEINVHYQPVNGGRFVAFLHDITSRKQKEEEMRQSEERYKSIFQNSNIVFLLIDPENGEIKDANAAALKFYGWSHAEICSKNIFDFNTLSKQEVADEMQKAKNDKRNHFLFKHRLANGLVRDVEVYSVPISFNKKTFIYSIVHDISERLEIEKALFESELKLRKFIDYAPHGVFVTNELGEYIDVNFSASKITGYSKEELLSMKITDLVPKESIEDAIGHFTKLSKEGFAKGDFPLLKKDKSTGYWSVDAVKLSDNLFLGFVVDITERKQTEEALKQSEESIRIKLQTILSPEGSIADLELNDIIDAPSIQKLMDNFYELAQIPMAIIDKKGKVLVGVGWQDICTKFHRVHRKACRNCFESDVHLTQGIPDGEFKLYKCKNNMWDMATPIIIGGEHKGNLFMGQFFFDDQPVDIEIFRKQASEYSFDERAYLDALDRVPRLNKNKLDYAKEFFLNFARSISQLSYGNIKLARAIEQQKSIEEVLLEKDLLLNKAEEIAHLGSWLLELRNNVLTWSDEMYRIFDVLPHEFPATYEGFLESVHPDDREAVNTAYTNSILEGKNNYEIVHRIFRKQSGELRYVLEKCEHVRDAFGKIIRSIGMTHDITEIKRTEEALQENERLFRESQAAAQIGSYSTDLIEKTWKATPAIYETFGIDETYPQTLDSWLQCVHPDFRAKLIKDLYKNNIGKNVFEHEYKIRRVNDGAERWVYGIGKFEYDNQMNPVRLIGTIQDITKRKLAEEALKKLNEELDDRVNKRTSELLKSNLALQKAEEKYRTIADYNYDWETWLGTDGKYIYVSPSCLRITGYQVEDFMNDPNLYGNIAHPDDREMVKNHRYEPRKVNNPDIAMDFRIITRNGEERWISHSCQPVYNTEGIWLGQRGRNSDITERKKAESFLVNSQDKLRALTQHMNELTENERKTIAREIHDELGHMLTALKYDIDSLINNPQLTIDQVNNELPDMFSMVESLIESVQKIATELRPGVLDHLGLLPAMEWQINQFRMMTKMNCIYTVPDDLDVTFDKTETTNIFRLLQEMLTNVARHSKANKVEISAHKENDLFVLNVKDNGVGFMVADKTQSGSLGLMGMNERALSIGAEIQIDSAPEKGTSISLLLVKK